MEENAMGVEETLRTVTGGAARPLLLLEYVSHATETTADVVRQRARLAHHRSRTRAAAINANRAQSKRQQSSVQRFSRPTIATTNSRTPHRDGRVRRT
jgi:hypothetical protein